MKSVSAKTWNRIPAIMILRPISVVDRTLDVDAMAPPAACRMRQIRSKVQKTRVYVLGLKYERWDP